MIITSKSGQSFDKQTTTIDAIRKASNENGVFVVIDCDNNDTFTAPLAAVSKAMSRIIGWEHLPFLVDAKIKYVRTERIAGQEFTFRPGDKRQLIAENDGAVISIVSIVPEKDVRDEFTGLPVYESRARDEQNGGSEPEPEPEPDPENTKLPAGAKATGGKGKNAPAETEGGTE